MFLFHNLICFPPRGKTEDFALRGILPLMRYVSENTWMYIVIANAKLQKLYAKIVQILFFRYVIWMKTSNVILHLSWKYCIMHCYLQWTYL